jgi:hypothetical protein
VLEVGETDSVPLVALAPLQPLEAVHDVALVELQVIVLLLPDVILEGEAEMVVVGGGFALVPILTLLLLALSLPELSKADTW